MPEFSYQAYDSAGRLVSGTVSAPHEGDALRALHVQGLLPFRTQEARPGAGRRRGFRGRRHVKAADVGLILRDLTTLLEAAIAVDHALRIAASQTSSPIRRAVLENLHEAVVRGNNLSEAMAAQPGIFPARQVAVARAGELAGSLPQAMRNLCVVIERDQELKGRILGAFLYPGILLAMALFAMGLIFAVMVPAITPLFDGGSRPMPLILVVATGTTAFLGSYGYILALLAAVAFAGLLHQLKNEENRLGLDRLILRLPLVGPMVQQAETARFARTFGTLLGSGAPLLQALAITSEAMHNRTLRNALAGAIDKLKRGTRLSDALSAVEALTEASKSLIAVGEETNRLPELLIRVAETNERDLNTRIERMMTVLTPVLTLIIGVLVGGIILSVMNAILSTNDLAF